MNKNGGGQIARNATQAKYPNLWRRLIRLYSQDVVAMAPHNKVPDFSVYKMHGTYTNGNASQCVGSSRGRVLFVNLDHGYYGPGASFVDMTINAWVEFRSFSSGQWVMASRLTSNPYFYVYVTSSSEIIFLMSTTGGQSYYQNTHGMVAGQWYLISMVKRGATLECYINGKLKPLTASATLDTTVDFSADNVYFGRENRAITSQLNGFLGEVSVYDRALDVREIKQMYAGASPLDHWEYNAQGLPFNNTAKPWLYYAQMRRVA